MKPRERESDDDKIPFVDVEEALERMDKESWNMRYRPLKWDLTCECGYPLLAHGPFRGVCRECNPRRWKILEKRHGKRD